MIKIYSNLVTVSPKLIHTISLEEVAFDPLVTMDVLQPLFRPHSPFCSSESLPKSTMGIYISSRGVSGICTRLCLHRMFKLDAD